MLTGFMLEHGTCCDLKNGALCSREVFDDGEPVRLALAGNPNCGKTTLFNAMTGGKEYVGNWPGVTVEKKKAKSSPLQARTVKRSARMGTR